MIFVGVDWAEAYHDVFVQDLAGRWLGGGRLPEGVAGVTRFHELIARHAGEPGEVMIGIETDRGLFVAALVAAGLPGLRGQPVVDVALPGPALGQRREIRSG